MTPSNPMSLEQVRESIAALEGDDAHRKLWVRSIDLELKRRESEAVPVADASDYVHPVPDHCDRIIWQGNYYQLPPYQPSRLSAPSQPSTGVPDGWAWYHADLSCLYTTVQSIRKRAIVRFVRDEPGQRWWHSLPEEQRDAVELYINAEGDSFESAMRNACVLAAAAPRSP